LVDKIPFIDAKTPSSITVTGEFAHLIPGHSRAIEKEGNAYIDDFEASESSIDIRTVHNWVLASTPQGKFPEADSTNKLAYNYNRAKIAWYYIDPLFLRNNSLTPEYMRKNPDYQCSHYVREIYQKEIFPNRETPSGMPTNIPVMNISYYPGQKGPYNYDVNQTDISDGINEDGTLRNPSSRWGGIMRDLSYSDFEESNIQYIDFWLMDPFVENKDAEGGQLLFNLGEISEDILKDGKKMFEHKLPEFDDSTGIEYTVWGRLPTADPYERSFDNGADRAHQDVGLDGLDNDHEKTFFNNYLDEIAQEFGSNSKAYKQAQQDPSNDDYMYFRSTLYDNQEADIIQRYKQYNGVEGNSPTDEQSPESYRTSATSLPDVEDINEDNTLKKGQEAYFEYKLNITPDSLRTGMNYIMDSVSTTGKGEECDNNTPVTWYHFRIPIKEYNRRVGPISDFRSIRFARMYFTGFEDSVIFRFATLDLVRSEWRKFNETLITPGEELSIPESPETRFSIGAVNIEENDNKEPVNYVLPPGITRVVDPADPQLRQLNEQAITFKVEELQDGHARAAYKTAQLDIREYKRLQMFVHAEEIPGREALNDGDVIAFIRIGSDFTENFYEYEIPLEITEPGNYKNGDEDERDRKLVWKNEIDIKLNQLPDLKLRRNDEMNKGSGIDYNTLYSEYIENNRLSIKGNPNLSDIKTIMIGVRNPRDQGNTGEPIAAEVWMNELRLSHFKEEGGWAANARVNTSLSDFANIDVAGSTLKPGFGSIEKKTNERSKEEIYRADLSSNIALGKFFPQKVGVRLPMYIGYSTSITTPQYNPLEPDVKFKKSLDRLESDSAKKALKNMAQEREYRKSINFTNVGINPSKAKQRIYSPSNFAFNLGYSKRFARNIDIDSLVEKRIKGGFVYNYSLRPKSVYPLRKLIKGRTFRLIRDFNFNYLPSLISWRSDFNAMYREQRLRNLSYSETEYKLPWTIEKNYIWQNDYKIKFDLARSLKLDWNAGNRARMDNPSENGIMRYEDPDNKYDNMTDELADNVFGDRVLQYQHKLGITYKVPINKIGLLDWTSANANYDGTYRWSAGPDYSHMDDINMGNTIDNSRNIRLSTRFQLTRLYNKVGFLERINKKNKRQKKEDLETVEYKENVDLRKGKSKSIYHKLGTEDVKVWVTDASGNEVKGELEVVNNNRVKFTPDETKNNATVQVEGKVAKKPNPLVVIGKQIVRTIMGVRDLSVSYSNGMATTIPGYDPDAKFFRLGMDDQNNPGVPFILGNTNEKWIDDNIDNGWLTKEVNVINPILFSKTKRVNVRSSFEPFDGVKIELSGNWNKSTSKKSYYTYDSAKGYPDSYYDASFTETGNLSMSYIAIGTAFEQVNDSNDYHSQAFENFKKYRKDIARRWAETRSRQDSDYNRDSTVYFPESGDSINYEDYPYGYGPYAQQNLIPAFLAAYGIRGVNKVPLESIKHWQYMLPNWRVRFNKLSEIDWIKERLKSVSLNHSYNCTYSTGSFVSNAEYDSAQPAVNQQGDFVQEYSFSGVSISEQFRPLVGIDVTFNNDLRVGAKWQKSRSMSLSFSSNRLTEIRSNEFSVGASYRFDEVPLILNFDNGDQKSFKSDLKLNADVGIRSNLSIYRDMEGGEPEISQGRQVVTWKFSADYAVSNNFTLRFFFNRQATNPFISRLYATRNTNIGFSVRFVLAQ
jgi:cell surface protein SprA